VVTGWSWCVARYGAPAARHLARAAIALAIVMPLALGIFTWRNDGRASTILKPLSPTSTNPRSIIEAAHFLRTSVVDQGRTLALDEDTTYQDLQLAFFARGDGNRTLRMRWPNFRERMLGEPPDVVVVFERGRLRNEPWVKLEEGRLIAGDDIYLERRGFAPPIRVFEREPPLAPRD
jgi:hypothetical protein